jgi:hypothetical protein
MSVDGGQTWFPMVPEPSAAVLMMMAMVGAVPIRTKRV